MSKDKGILMTQVQTDVTLISFLSVVSIFFIGALLPEFSSYDLSVKIPISFLIVSTFAFIFSALILANGTHSIISDDAKRFEKHMVYGYAISEYLGFFLLVLSVPLAMSIVTEDIYIRFVTFIAAMLGFVVYQFCGFSVLERHFLRSHRFISLIMVAFGVALFFSHLYQFHFTLISIIFLVFVLLVTALGPAKRIQ